MAPAPSPSASETLDALVVGGGIHGVGLAQALAAAGHPVLLAEKSDLAAGTSSRSSKLIHGGLRYLESGDLRLVRESLRERALLVRLAPDLVRLVPFLLPVYRGARRRPSWIRAGLSLYAVLGGLGPAARFQAVPRAEWDGLDGLTTAGLAAVYRYHDGQTDDAALCRAVAASAAELGARIECGTELLRAVWDGRVWTVRLAGPSGERTERARTLVNAAGPWAELVAARIRPSQLAARTHRPVQLVGGTHIEFEGRLERGVYYVEAPEDARAVFSIPWRGRTLVGTTEAPWTGDPSDVAPTEAEVEYLESTFARCFPGRAVQRLDAWAGLRVLPAGSGRAFHRSREVVLAVDDPRAPRLLTVYGGKLTAYRATAERAAALLARGLPGRTARARTDELPLALQPGDRAPWSGDSLRTDGEEAA